MISDVCAGVYSGLNTGRWIQEVLRLECWQAVSDLLVRSAPADRVSKHEDDWHLRPGTCALMTEVKCRHSAANGTRCSYRGNLLEAHAEPSSGVIVVFYAVGRNCEVLTWQ